MAASSLLCFVVLCLSFLAANGLKCFSCKDDYYHGLNASELTCLDEAWDPETGENPHQTVIDCGNANDTACYKYYTMNYEVVQGKKTLVTRLIERNCTQVPEEELGCTYDKGSAAYSYRCFCTEDGCNSASVLHFSVPFLALLISLAILSSRI